MIVASAWYARDLWTLIEAAQIFAGIEPYLGGVATDSPHDILARIPDEAVRAKFQLLYERSKDATDIGKLPFVPSRTGNFGNKRVRPSDYLAWADKSGLPISSDVRLPKDSSQTQTTGGRDVIPGFSSGSI